MNISHHPDPSWFVSYAADALNTSYHAVLKAHLGVCVSCRETLRSADAIGALFMFEQTAEPEPVDVPTAVASPMPNLTTATLRDIEWMQDDAPNLDHVLSEYVGDHLDSLRWMRAGKGLRVCRLRAAANDRMWLLRAEPGTVLPKHSHTSSELTLVLKGAYESQGSLFRIGDIEDADDTVEHQPLVADGEECICLAALEDKLRFSGFLPKLVQPLIGI